MKAQQFTTVLMVHTSRKAVVEYSAKTTLEVMIQKQILASKSLHFYVQNVMRALSQMPLPGNAMGYAQSLRLWSLSY